MTFTERVKIFSRLHLLQMLWNFKGMQHFGFLYAIRPILKRLYTGEEYLAAEKRQGLFFNTHPYFAPICMGVVIKLEEEHEAGSFSKPEMIPVLKNRMSGPLAAVGDAFFWETVRPVIASLAVFSILGLGPGTPDAIKALAILLFTYIGMAEYMRWQGLQWGYRHGLAVIEILKKKDFHAGMRRIRNAGALALGIATVFYIIEDAKHGPVEPITRIAALIFMLIGTAHKVSPTILLYLLVIGGLIVGIRS